MNWRNTSGLTCGSRTGVGVPGAAGDTEQPGMRQISPRLAVLKLLQL